MLNVIAYYTVIVSLSLGLMMDMTSANPVATKLYQAPQGFHWYQIAPLPPVGAAATQKPDQHNDPVKQMAALRAVVTASLDRAILYPTVENATRYLALNNVLMKNASNFSLIMQQALLVHPDMNYAINHPTQSAARKVLLKDRETNAMNAVKVLTKHNGCVFFYRGKQPLDQLMAKTLADFSQKYGIKTIGISVDHTVLPLFAVNRRDNGQAKSLHVRAYPALLLVNPTTYHIQPVTYGVLSEAELLDRFWLLARHFKE